MFQIRRPRPFLGDQGHLWHPVDVAVPANVSRIRFVAWSYHWNGDHALDNIVLATGTTVANTSSPEVSTEDDDAGLRCYTSSTVLMDPDPDGVYDFGPGDGDDIWQRGPGNVVQCGAGDACFAMEYEWPPRSTYDAFADVFEAMYYGALGDASTGILPRARPRTWVTLAGCASSFVALEDDLSYPNASNGISSQGCQDWRWAASGYIALHAPIGSSKVVLRT